MPQVRESATMPTSYAVAGSLATLRNEVQNGWAVLRLRLSHSFAWMLAGRTAAVISIGCYPSPSPHLDSSCERRLGMAVPPGCEGS